jgi:DNA-binding CsgD family transcriptional regulator
MTLDVSPIQPRDLRAVFRLSRERLARLLGVSAKTVETHRAQIMERLDIHDVPGLVRYAIRVGLVRAEE